MEKEVAVRGRSAGERRGREAQAAKTKSTIYRYPEIRAKDLGWLESLASCSGDRKRKRETKREGRYKEAAFLEAHNFDLPFFFVLGHPVHRRAKTIGLRVLLLAASSEARPGATQASLDPERLSCSTLHRRTDCPSSRSFQRPPRQPECPVYSTTRLRRCASVQLFILYHTLSY